MTRSALRVGGLAVCCALALTACSTDSSRPDTRRTTESKATTSTKPPPPAHPRPGAAGAGDPYYPADGNGGYNVADYHLKITYNPASRHLSGDATITATARQDLSRFDLDLYQLAVTSVAVDGKPARTFSQVGKHELVITPAEALRDGQRFAVRVRYGGKPHTVHDVAFGDNGWTVSPTGGAFVAGEPHSATTWYPANDTPSDKATFHLTARVPSAWSVISNGRPVSRKTKDGWTTFTWAEETPIATYLTTVGIDKWGFVESKLEDGTPVLDAYAPGSESFHTDEDRLPEVLSFLVSKFGDYPQNAAGSIVLGTSIGYSLETQTRPVYSEGVDLATIVHENAHQWYGDSVSVRDWKDICLNECFASYAEDLWAEAKEGVDLDARYRAAVRSVRNSQGFWAGKLYDMGAGNEFDAVYTKGALALHALRRQIGDEAFDKILKGWPAEHRNGNASWPQFESYAARVSGQQLGGFFQAWFHGSTIPRARYLWPGSLHP
ncbi:MAG: M1 family metallopeptidase [Sciscionella sp.]